MKKMLYENLTIVMSIVVILVAGLFIAPSNSSLAGFAVIDPCDVCEDGSYDVMDLLASIDYIFEGELDAEDFPTCGGDISNPPSCIDYNNDGGYDLRDWRPFVRDHLTVMNAGCELVGDINDNGIYQIDDFVEFGNEYYFGGGTFNGCVDVDRNGVISEEEFEFYYYSYLFRLDICGARIVPTLTPVLIANDIEQFEEGIVCIDDDEFGDNEYKRLFTKLNELYEDLVIDLECSVTPTEGPYPLEVNFACTISNGLPNYDINLDIFLDGETEPTDSTFAGTDNGEFEYDSDPLLPGDYDWYISVTDHKFPPNEEVYFADSTENSDLRILVDAGCVDNDGDGASPTEIYCGEIDCDDNDPDRYPGANETCDNKDNDCNMKVDDDIVEICGPDITFGECKKGTRICVVGEWQSCIGAVYPINEIPVDILCKDGKDNDCDGDADNLDDSCRECEEGATISCGTDLGECVQGEISCEDGQWTTCNDVKPKTETCDGKDNDCDGVIDEGCSCTNSTRECGTELGECKKGVQKCENDQWTVCIGSISPRDEVSSNNKDDDCDGSVDEGSPCLTGEDRDCGECGDGTQVCDNSMWGDCVGFSAASEEVCDGKDNDCDGSVDEGLIRECGAAIGVCTKGYETCSNGQWGSCNASSQKSEEKCDGLDNDCDGKTDEGETGALSSDCYSGDDNTKDVGECKSGTRTCSNRMWGSCTGEVLPVEEECDDEKDNDCDGSVDEGCSCEAGKTQDCGIAEGECKKGVQSCVGGEWGTCVGSISPKNETCDNKDNDCDGEIDENCVDCVDGTTKPCGDERGECKKGTVICEEGKWGSCIGAVNGTVEICDGLDNDCDGSTDEDFNLQVDISNCGSCGTACGFDEECVSGICAGEDIQMAVQTANNVLPENPVIQREEEEYQEQFEPIIESPAPTSGNGMFIFIIVMLFSLTAAGGGFVWYEMEKGGFGAGNDMKSLVNYAKHMRDKGYSRDKIYKGLIKQGWDKKKVDKVFKKVQ